MHEVQKKVRIFRMLLFCILTAGVLLFLYSYFHMDEFTVKGTSYYTEEEMKEKLVTSSLEKNTLYFFFKYQYREKPEIPFIQDLEITLSAHNKVLVTVYEKTMIACVKYMNEYLYFDKDGIVVESSSQKMDQVLLVTGVQIDEMTLYQPLKVANPDVFKKILELSQSIERYEVKADRIAFNLKEEVTLYSGDIKILLGKRERHDVQIAELSNLLKEAEKEGLKGTLQMEDFEEGQGKVTFYKE